MLNPHSIVHLLETNRLTLFGLVAVSLMLICYALEDRSTFFVLAFAISCMLGSAYGFLQGAWPFGLVEGVWSLVALRRWYQLANPASKPQAHLLPSPVDTFMEDLLAHSRLEGSLQYQFADEAGEAIGFVQIGHPSKKQILIHRIWATSPGQGAGSQMLRTLCDLADLHGVEIVLRPLPFGDKPYPRSIAELQQWYGRFGFSGTAKRMIRTPQPQMAELV